MSAAVSLTDALTRRSPSDYANAGRGAVRFNFAASNVLARQIVSGAPVDLFISADEAQMDVVAPRRPASRTAAASICSRNQLAVVVPERSAADVRRASRRSPIPRSGGSRSAIPPPSRPASTRSSTSRRKDCGRRIAGARSCRPGSVRAALTAVESGAADAAIVYRTDARVALRATVAWVVPADRGPRIVYPAAIVRRIDAPRPRRQRFLDFLRGADAAPRLRAVRLHRVLTAAIADGRLADHLVHRRLRRGGDRADAARRRGGRLAAGAPQVSRARARRNAGVAAAGDAAGRDRTDPADAAQPPRRVGGVLERLGIEIVFTWKAVVLAMAIMGLPLLVRTARAGFEQVNARYERVAATLGAPPAARVPDDQPAAGVAVGAGRRRPRASPARSASSARRSSSPAASRARRARWRSASTRYAETGQDAQALGAGPRSRSRSRSSRCGRPTGWSSGARA